MNESVLDEGEEFPLGSDLANLLDAMEQIPIVDATPERRRSPQSITINMVDGSTAVVPVPEDFEDENDEVGILAPNSKPKVRKVGKKPLPESVVKVPTVAGGDTGGNVISRKRLLEIATDIFGDERVSMDGGEKEYSLTILFPEFTITNANGNKHVIRDLYVVFNIMDYRDMPTETTGFNVGLFGSRGKLTVAEFRHGYAHSHLPGSATQGQLHSFCQGSSQFKIITTNLVTKPTEDQWELALQSLTNYVNWESLEGGPHKRMAEIPKSRQSRNFDYRRELIKWVDKLPTEVFDMPGELKLITNSDVLQRFYDLNSSVKLLTTSGNDPQEIAQAQQDYDRGSRIGFTFKGKTPKMQIVPDGTIGEPQNFVDKEIVGQYNVILTTQLQSFNKRLDYEYIRFKNAGNLGKAPSFEPADINHYKATAGKDRAAARAGRKQGVVGRVNHLRKREDNRLG